MCWFNVLNGSEQIKINRKDSAIFPTYIPIQLFRLAFFYMISIFISPEYNLVFSNIYFLIFIVFHEF